MNRTALAVLACLLLAACSDQQTEKPEEEKSHIWQGQVDMLNKAKKVGEDVNAHLRQQEERLKAAQE